jgi:DNA-3-methyladenine glycosylase I
MNSPDLERCPWARNAIEIDYHDKEWGVPVHDDRTLFEFLILEGAQAGLSWETVLRKREHYRKVYDNFDVQRVARYSDAKCARLLQDAGIIRNRLKVASSVSNAQAFIEVQEEFGSFANYLWGFVDGEPIKNRWKTTAEVPATTELSDRLSKLFKKRGFRFVGSTIVYAFLQGVGVVDDHLTSCFCYSGARRRKA